MPLVPEGLVLLTSLTFAVAAVRLARIGTLAQRLNAVESLASVDTLCLDKTGTLTENRIRVSGLEPVDGRGEEALRADLATLAASAGAQNATMRAVAEAAPGAAVPVSERGPVLLRAQVERPDPGGRRHPGARRAPTCSRAAGCP